MIFDRQIAFWGEEKQELLRKSSVFVAGVGGLGCLLSEILVRSGVGRVYICDKGIVDEPDLNRQLFYTQNDIGKKKIDIATEWLTKIHAYTEIIPLSDDIMKDDFSLPEDINGVSDCLDNFESRFSLWARVKEGSFYIHAGVEEFFGQVSTLVKGRSPELSDIFDNYDNRERTIPVSANSASTISALASTELINNLFGEPKLLNTLLIIDLSDFTFDKVSLSVEES
jgi:molybdopterin/thiamine biosynthesis adenylyltransferase